MITTYKNKPLDVLSGDYGQAKDKKKDLIDRLSTVMPGADGLDNLLAHDIEDVIDLVATLEVNNDDLKLRLNAAVEQIDEERRKYRPPCSVWCEICKDNHTSPACIGVSRY